MRPLVLMILDGWGYSTNTTGNAIANGATPNLDEILNKYPSTLLQASGPAVGMTFGETGNSEVGHLTLGAGRIIFQYLVRINKAISNGEFFKNEALTQAAQHVQTNNSTLHIAGLLTSGAVHAHLDHLVALVKFAKDRNLNYKIHLFSDGRDSGLKEAPETLKKLEAQIGGFDHVATLIGRDAAMDRGGNWDRTAAAFNLIVKGQGEPATDLYTAIQAQYAAGKNDPNLAGIVLKKEAGLSSETLVKEGDAIVFFNFREDSMRQITSCFTEKTIDKFQRDLPADIFVAAMTQYGDFETLHAMFPPPVIEHCLAEVLSANGKKQFHIAETEKYAHVTYFFNALREAPFGGETNFFIQSLENPLEQPQMRARDIADKVIRELDRGEYDMYIINIANGDILAHLGNLEVAIKGVGAADETIGMIKQKVLEKDGLMIITADHGNAEAMIYKDTGAAETKHDDNPVPFHLIAREYEKPQSNESGRPHEVTGLLADVAPTILELLGIVQPDEMTGSSLLKTLA